MSKNIPDGSVHKTGQILSPSERLVERAHWITRLRWITTIFVAAATYIASRFLGISFNTQALYYIAIILGLYNALTVFFLHHFTKTPAIRDKVIQRLFDVQISADLVILTFVLHYSGGIENPFVFFFLFHMVIASTLLSIWQSFLQATFAVLLFGLMLLLEYSHIIAHYCLKGYVSYCLYSDGTYVLGTYFGFVTGIYLVVYMTSSIAARMRNAEAAYRLVNEQLLDKDRIKDEYVLRVSHDIKGDLAAIGSSLHVVVNKYAGDLTREQEEILNTGVRRMNTLTAFVKALLNLTSIRLRKKFEVSDFSLPKAIDNVVSAVEQKAAQKSISLEKQISLTDEQMYGNNMLIEEAMTNLVLNSIKYTPAKGTITLKAQDNIEFVRIEIADTGIGIPEGEQKMVFDEFYRASNAKRVEKDGTGLGLSIVKQIVETHKGRMGLESRENVGTKIWLEFPKVKNR